MHGYNNFGRMMMAIGEMHVYTTQIASSPCAGRPFFPIIEREGEGENGLVLIAWMIVRTHIMDRSLQPAQFKSNNSFCSG